MNSDVKYTTYSEIQEKIIESGISAIKQVFDNNDILEIRSLLFCLDKYLDPYFKHNLAYINDIFDMLQLQLLIQNDKDVIDDIVQLIGDYASIRLDILHTHKDSLEGYKFVQIQRLLEMP